MLSRRVIAYYGLMRASESLPAAYGFAAGAAAPKENGLRWESRGSPIYSAGLCSRAASHTPATRSVRLTVPSSSVLAFTPVSRVRRHIGSFEAAEFTHSQVHRNCYGPRAGLPSFRGRLHSSLRRRGRPQSASNMTTWINSQFPRPDFHRQVQRHYGLQDTGFPWVFDYRTNIHHTLKTKPLKRSDLDEFVACYHPENRHERKATWSQTNPEGRWRCFSSEEPAKRDKLNLDIFWIKDKSLEDADSLP